MCSGTSLALLELWQDGSDSPIQIEMIWLEDSEDFLSVSRTDPVNLQTGLVDSHERL